MNFLVAFLLVVVPFVTAVPIEGDYDEPNDLAANNQACIDRTGVTSQQIEELRENPKIVTSKPGMCYIKCMAELGGLEKEGLIQKDIAVTKRPEGISKEEAEKLIEECSKLDAEDSCESSYIKYICVFEGSERKAWLRIE